MGNELKRLNRRQFPKQVNPRITRGYKVEGRLETRTLNLVKITFKKLMRGKSQIRGKKGRKVAG